MKKTALISILLLVSLLFGCANNADPSSGTEPASSAEKNVTTSDNEETTAGDPEKSEEEALAEYYKNYLDSEDFGYLGLGTQVYFSIKSEVNEDGFFDTMDFAPGYFRFGQQDLADYYDKTLEIINSGRFIDFTTTRCEDTKLPEGRVYVLDNNGFDSIYYEYREIRRYRIRNKDVFPEEVEELKNRFIPYFELEGEMTYVESSGRGDVLTCGDKTVYIDRETKKILSVKLNDPKTIEYEYYDRTTGKNEIALFTLRSIGYYYAAEEIALPGYRSSYDGYKINAEPMSYEEATEWFFKELNDYICDIVHLVIEE